MVFKFVYSKSYIVLTGLHVGAELLMINDFYPPQHVLENLKYNMNLCRLVTT